GTFPDFSLWLLALVSWKVTAVFTSRTVWRRCIRRPPVRRGNDTTLLTGVLSAGVTFPTTVSVVVAVTTWFGPSAEAAIVMRCPVGGVIVPVRNLLQQVDEFADPLTRQVVTAMHVHRQPPTQVGWLSCCPAASVAETTGRKRAQDEVDAVGLLPDIAPSCTMN